jgi:hypothetical protein
MEAVIDCNVSLSILKHVIVIQKRLINVAGGAVSVGTGFMSRSSYQPS